MSHAGAEATQPCSASVLKCRCLYLYVHVRTHAGDAMSCLQPTFCRTRPAEGHGTCMPCKRTHARTRRHPAGFLHAHVPRLHSVFLSQGLARGSFLARCRRSRSGFLCPCRPTSHTCHASAPQPRKPLLFCPSTPAPKHPARSATHPARSQVQLGRLTAEFQTVTEDWKRKFSTRR